MPAEIRCYDDSLLDELVSVFNRETASAPFVVPLTAEIARERIISKPVFDAMGSFLLFDGAKPIGCALTCTGVNGAGIEADPSIGVVDGLFFPAEEFLLGEQLLARCLQHLRDRGVHRIYGFASYGGYPFWRGLYCGAEPVCLTDYRQAWIAFMAQGFTHHQQSLNYLGQTRSLPHRSDLTYSLSDLDVSSPWASMSWKGLRPQVVAAARGDEVVGTIGYVEMPFLSEYRTVSTGGIYSMRVDPSARRQGVAASLVSALFEHAAGRGVKEILVGTTVQNVAARKTYEKAGMRIVSFRTGTNLVLEGS